MPHLYFKVDFYTDWVSFSENHRIRHFENDLKCFPKCFQKTSLFCSVSPKVPFLSLNSPGIHNYFFHTVNCLKKKGLVFWLDFSSEMCLRPELFLSIWFFQYLYLFHTDGAAFISAGLNSIYFTYSHLVWQIMFYF